MRKILLGLVAAAAIATPLVAAASANAQVAVNDSAYDSSTAAEHQTAVALTDSTGQPLPGGDVWTVAPDGTWAKIGTTDSTGAVSAELAPRDDLQLRDGSTAVHGRASRCWWAPTAPQVAFKTASATVTFKNSKDQPRADGVVWARGSGRHLDPASAPRTPTGPCPLSCSRVDLRVHDGLRRCTAEPVGAGRRRRHLGGLQHVSGGGPWPGDDRCCWDDDSGPDGHLVVHRTRRGMARSRHDRTRSGDAITQLLPGTYTFVHVADDGTRHEFKDVTVASSPADRF